MCISTEMKRRWLSLAMIFVAGCCGDIEQCRSESVMLSTSYAENGRNLQDRGTGVCIASTERGSLIVTCRHNVASNPDGVWVYHNHDWYQCGRAVMHPTEDLATIETSVRFQPTPLADDSPIGEPVSIEGAGPAAHRSNEPVAFSGRILTDDTIAGDDGRHLILGDSGGPVLYRNGSHQTCVVGIADAVEGTIGPTHRRQFPGAKTQFVSCRRITSWLVTQYGGCPGGICPVRIRPQIQQPMIGIGIPTGPPRIVNTIEPAPRIYPQVNCPPIAGPPGPAGRDGRSVTREEVEAVVNAWLDTNAERLRGPAGPAGPAGPGSAANTATLERRISDLERRPFRLILSSEGKVIDDETYAPGEPVVLDLQRLRNRSDAK